MAVSDPTTQSRVLRNLCLLWNLVGTVNTFLLFSLGAAGLPFAIALGILVLYVSVSLDLRHFTP